MIDLRQLHGYRGTALYRAANFMHLAPHPALRPYIAGYSLSSPVGMAAGQMVLPSASCTIVVSAGEGGVVGGIRGPNTRPVGIAAHATQFPLLLLVEFHPGGLVPFVHLDQSELADSGAPLDALDKQLAHSVEEVFLAAAGIEELAERLNGLFLARMEESRRHPAVAHTMHRLLAAHGGISTRVLAGEVFYSGKQLNRLFHCAVGTSVKTFSRIVRASHTLRQVGTGAVLEKLAEKGGYTDASHLVRELKWFCGVPPSAYLADVSLLYNDPFKL